MLKVEAFLKVTSALNDETRVLILRFMDTHGELCVCDLQASFDMVQSRLSRHLKILKEAGFLVVQRQGKWAHYAIKSPLEPFENEALKAIRCLDVQLPSLNKPSAKGECAL